MHKPPLANPVKIEDQQFAGQHLVADLWDCDFLCDGSKIKSIMVKAAQAANATVLESWIHDFPGGGLTGVVLLAESHISIHTWPDHGYAAVDIFMCGETVASKALEVLITGLNAGQHELNTLNRGKLTEKKQHKANA